MIPAEPQPDMLALENQVCFALAVATRKVIAAYRPLLDPMGLTHPQYLSMLALWERSPRTVVDLSRALALEPATLSPLLKRLEAAGLVTRSRGTDERTLDVALTDAGRELRAEAQTVPPRVAAMLDMSIPELDALRRVLHRVIAATDSA
ncbi:MAG: MarR family transcriptional regulator [Schumannella sp.]|nr:MarR family transcriptional regulator [Schumannella sp.]